VYQTADREREYRALLSRGDAALRNRDASGAIAEYSGAIALRPDSMLPHLRRGEAYRQRNEFEAAARDFRIAASLDPSATRPLEALGDVEYRRRWYQRAGDYYETRLKLDDRSAIVWYKLALARYRAGSLEAALSAGTESLRLNAPFPDAQYLLGVCLREMGRSAEAVEAFEKALAVSPGLIPAREELADLYASLGRKGDELQQLQVLAGLDRDRVERQVAVSLAHARGGHGKVAVTTLGGVLERMPDRPMIFSALGQVWLDMADTRGDAISKALEALERGASETAATSEMLTLYGRALVKADRPEAAERVLQQAMRRFPVDLAAFPAYADVAERLGHSESARTALVEYAALVPNDPDRASHSLRIARLSLRLNQPPVAVAWLQRAALAKPADVGILVQLADAQLRTGDRDGARATIAAGLAKQPDNASLLALDHRIR
jgi:tetratricopeptide (TPR) repeat protein